MTQTRRTTPVTTDDQIKVSLGRELRKRYKSPRDVLRRLGIGHVLDHPRLTYDARFAGPNGSFSKATLDRLLADDTVGLTAPNEGLSDEERENVEIEVAQDEIDRRVDRVLDHLRTNHGDKLTEDDLDVVRPMIEEEVRDHLRHKRNGRDEVPDLPRNSLGGGAAGGGPGSGFEGRLSEPSWRSASSRDTWGGTLNSRSPLETMSPAEKRLARETADRQAAKDRKFVADEKRRRAFEDRFDLAPRVLETGLESATERELRAARAEQALQARRSPEKRLAADAKRAKAAKSFRDRYPGAARIGFA